MDQRYVALADKIGLGHSERIARLFEHLADGTAADILLSLPTQTPKIAQDLSLPLAEVEAKIEDLFVKGVVFPSSKTDPPTYRLCRDLIQFHDASILWPEAPRAFLDLWRDFMDEEWLAIARAMAANMPKPYTRIIPVGVSIEPRARVLDFESVSDIVRRSRNLAVTKCTCRLTMQKCDRPLEVCLQVNRAADYTLARGTGRRVSQDEALALLKECEEQGLIHVTFNRLEVEHFICNCCPCCCQTMPVLIKGGIHVIDPSRFRAQIDEALCSGCGLCLERCYFGALSLDEGERESTGQVDAKKCMGCGLCLIACPEEAIQLIEVRPAAFVPGAAGIV